MKVKYSVELLLEEGADLLLNRVFKDKDPALDDFYDDVLKIVEGAVQDEVLDLVSIPQPNFGLQHLPLEFSGAVEYPARRPHRPPIQNIPILGKYFVELIDKIIQVDGFVIADRAVLPPGVAMAAEIKSRANYVIFNQKILDTLEFIGVAPVGVAVNHDLLFVLHLVLIDLFVLMGGLPAARVGLGKPKGGLLA